MAARCAVLSLIFLLLAGRALAADAGTQVDGAAAAPTGVVSTDEDDETYATPAQVPSATPAPPVLPTKPLEDVNVTLARVLGDRRYTFCHDPSRPVRDDRALCEYAKAHVAACPAFAEACANASPPPSRAKIPRWVAGLSEFLFWGLVAAAAIWVVARVVRHFAESRSDGDRAEAPGEDFAGPAETAPELAPRVDRDAARLLARAEEALRGGDTPAAARLGHAALLRALEAAELVHVERSSTNGDYLRALAGKSEVRDVFRVAARQVERSEFGDQAPAADALRTLLARIHPIVNRLVALCLPLLLSLSACGGTVRESEEDAPRGYSVFRRLLDERGATLTRRFRPLSELHTEETDLVVVLPSAPLDEAAWGELMSWSTTGGTVMLLGSHPTLPKELGVEKEPGKPCADKPRVVMDERFAGAAVTARAGTLGLDAAWTPLVVCGEGPVVAVRDFGDDGSMYAVADPAFLTNASLASGDHARVAFEIIDATSVSLVDHRVGAGASSPYGAIGASGMLPMLAQGLVALLAWVLAAGASFGSARDPREPPRRAFSEHVRAVGRLYARAGASRHAFGAFAGWALDGLGARLRTGGTGRVLDLGSAVSKVTGRKEGEVAALLAEAADARDRPAQPPGPEDLVLLSALDDLVHETGGRR